MATPLFLGLDFGTSGARTCVIAPNGEIEEMARANYGNAGEAATWRDALFELITGLPQGLRKRLAAVAVDGTSATVLACDADLQPLHAPLMYDDARAAGEVGRIAAVAGEDHPAATATSALAKLLWLQRHLAPVRPTIFLNQADWLSGQLSGRAVSDTHNALKMGVDVDSNSWPAWQTALTGSACLPNLARPGETVARVSGQVGQRLGLSSDCLVPAGTTDSIAAFLAAGVHQPGEAVTSLGTTLVLKLLSATRVESAAYGIYSHWFGRLWLTGGASNAGGGVLRQHFSDSELTTLSAGIDTNRPSGLDYYPLPRPGERFPIRDPALVPRMEPRPSDRTAFLHALLEGLARIEALGYRRLAELGATPLTRVTSAGGGARNPAYTQLRQCLLGVPVSVAHEHEAAYGSARLACYGTGLFPGERQR